MDTMKIIKLKKRFLSTVKKHCERQYCNSKEQEFEILNLVIYPRLYGGVIIFFDIFTITQCSYCKFWFNEKVVSFDTDLQEVTEFITNSHYYEMFKEEIFNQKELMISFLQEEVNNKS